MTAVPFAFVCQMDLSTGKAVVVAQGSEALRMMREVDPPRPPTRPLVTPASPYQVACPYCRAAAGDACVTNVGRKRGCHEIRAKVRV